MGQKFHVTMKRMLSYLDTTFHPGHILISIQVCISEIPNFFPILILIILIGGFEEDRLRKVLPQIIFWLLGKISPVI